MRNADLAEIRARLQAAAEPPRRPGLGLFAGLRAHRPRAAAPAVPIQAAAPPGPSAPAPQPAFGQRADTEAPLQLEAPLPSEPPLVLAAPIPEPSRDERLTRLERALLAERASLDARRP